MANQITAPNMSESEILRAQIETLKTENEALKARKGEPKGTLLGDGLSAQVSSKGAVSVYGFGKWPVTLYKEQFMRLLKHSSQIISFINANEAELKVRPITDKVTKA